MTFEELVVFVKVNSDSEGIKAVRSYARKNRLSLVEVEGSVFVAIYFRD